MTNGFYNIIDKTIEEKRNFLRDAVKLAYSVECQRIGAGKSSVARAIDKELSVKGVINEALKSNHHHIVCIDRLDYDKDSSILRTDNYEIGISYDSKFLYIFVNKKNFNILLRKHKLKLIEWN